MKGGECLLHVVFDSGIGDSFFKFCEHSTEVGIAARLCGVSVF